MFWGRGQGGDSINSCLTVLQSTAFIASPHPTGSSRPLRFSRALLAPSRRRSFILLTYLCMALAAALKSLFDSLHAELGCWLL